MIRVFPRKTAWTPTDELAFVGNPPLFRPEGQTVHVSVTFTWDIPEGKRLFRAWSDFYYDVHLGGPAFDNQGGSFVPGRFVKNGITITSRGCTKHCPWCFVPKREGPIRVLPIQPGNNVADNNILACPREHIEAVFEMLKGQKSVTFSGGLDTVLLERWHVDELQELSIKQMFFACDTPNALRSLERASDLLADFGIGKKRCYVLIGYNGENLASAENRLEKVYDLGFLPFAMLYRSTDGHKWSREWRELQRRWSRPAIYRGRKPT